MTRINDAKGHARRLSHMRAEHLERLAEINADERYAPEFKQRLVADERAEFAHVAKASAGRAWRATNRLLDDAESDLKAAAKAAADAVDESKVAARISIYEAEIRAAKAAENPMKDGSSAFDYMARKRDELARIDDTDSMYALRLAAAPVLNSADTNDAGTFAKASAMLAQFAEDERNEQPADVRQFESEVPELETARNDLRRLILRVEDTATGRPRESVFSTLSEWQRDVLNESNESTGRVVWKTPAAAD